MSFPSPVPDIPMAAAALLLPSLSSARIALPFAAREGRQEPIGRLIDLLINCVTPTKSSRYAVLRCVRSR
jgi:hypothetical protein